MPLLFPLKKEKKDRRGGEKCTWCQKQGREGVSKGLYYILQNSLLFLTGSEWDVFSIKRNVRRRKQK
jgi:hypothetical protein